MNYQKTKNARGYMHPLSKISEQFIQFSKSNSPVMDMGCAYGNVLISALEAGAEKVFGCDMEQQHLDILNESIAPIYKNKLTTIQGKLPDGFAFGENTFSAIHTSHVLEYLDDKEIDRALENFYRWLKPNGKIYIVCYSIFIKELMNEKFQTEYQKRLNENVKWPGYLKDYDLYTTPIEDSECDSSAFPPDLQMYTVPTLVTALQELGFNIDFAEYLEGSEHGAVKETWNEGKEMVGIIATKPVLKA